MRDALELLLDVAGEARAREIVAVLGTRTAQLELDRLATVRLAVRMLAERSSRSTIRDRLVARGVHVRRAYRLISDALTYGPFSCDSGGPSVSLTPETLGPSNELEFPVMEQQTTAATKPDHLNAAADELRARLAAITAIELPAAREQLQSALAARDALPDMGSSMAQSPPGADRATPELLQSIAVRDRIYEEAKAAPARVRRLEVDEQQLRTSLAEIKALIDGEATLDRARQAVSVAEGDYLAGMRTRLECERALERLTGLVESEQQQLDAARRAAGAHVLAAIKGGANDVIVEPASSDRLAALLEAKDAAQGELRAAQTTEKGALARLGTARHQVLVAHSTTLEAAFKPIEVAYRENLVALIVAKSNARIAYMPADPREQARDEAGRILGVFS